MSFTGYVGSDSGVVVSVGRTHRDLELLARAARSAGVALVLHDTVEAAHPATTIRVGAGYERALADIARCAIVAIPLSRCDGTFGLTELNDALALAKPVIMTRNRYIDVDIEGVGCGIWVDAGDEAGWIGALARLSSDGALREAMGQRGRKFAEADWNYDLFGAALVSAVKAALGE